MATGTRSNCKLYLVDSFVEDITGSKLPSNREVFGYFLFLHLQKKQTIRDSATEAIEKALVFWRKANIPVKHKQDAIKKLESMFHHWQGLKRHSSRKTKTQSRKEDDFTSNLENLFDIAHTRALDIMTIEEDRKFLVEQRKQGRRGHLGSLDKAFLGKRKRANQRAVAQKQQQLKSKKQLDELTSTATLETSSEAEMSTDECLPSSSDTEVMAQKRERRAFMTPELSASLDRAKVSDRSALMIVGETALSLGHNVDDVSLSRSTIRRTRQKHRKQTMEEIKKNMSLDSPVIVHWDSKLMPGLQEQSTVDRLPILVCGQGQSQLLSAPKIPTSSGNSQAQAVVATLVDWNLDGIVDGMCFDTTSSNTGRKNGACIIIEQMLGRDLLYLACRHHVLELIAGAAYQEAMGISSGPEIALFKRFKEQWKFFDLSKYDDASTDGEATQGVQEVKQDLTAFLSSVLVHNQLPRGDYCELVELTLLFLGFIPPLGIRFRAPGAMHHARWMAKVIYTFKVWMFRKQFKLTPKESKGLRDLCIFFTRVYVKAWIQAPLAAKAPYGDLCLLKNLIEYKLIHKDISRSTTKKMAGHLWYLSEELIGLAFFDDDISADTKDQMVKALNSNEGDEEPLKRVAVTLDSFKERTLQSFVTSNTRSLFKKLHISDDFLQQPAEDWETNDQFLAGKAVVKSLAVVNDHAERGVALVQGYSGHLTKDEEQLQFLLQVVAHHRKQYPHALKQTLTSQGSSH